MPASNSWKQPVTSKPRSPNDFENSYNRCMRWYTTELPRISIKDVLRVASVTWPHQSRIQLSIGEPYNTSVSLAITATTPFYGGQRYWIVCPELSCSRRTTDLYVQDGIVACRKCLYLKYETQYYSKDTIYGACLAIIQAGELEQSGRRLWYDGKPTRTGRRYLKLCQQAHSMEMTSAR